MIRRLTLVMGCAALTSCNLAPVYHVPTAAPLAAGFKAAPGWVVSMPADDVAKGAWWQLFNDPVLGALEAKVEFTNQNVAAARAAYAQARALVAQQRATLFPSISASAGAQRSGSFGNNATSIISTGGTTGTGTGAGTGFTTSGRNASYNAQIGASWEPDLFGRLTNGVRQSRATAQASAADLANATLAARGELAIDYLQLRGSEAQSALLAQTITAYARALTIAINKYNAGVVSRADVETARTQLANARISAREAGRNRAVLEDAIAVLVGENPSGFAIAPVAWAPVVPVVPGVLPTDILQRRPDIAAAERNVAAANAAIGIQRAGYFPSLSLSGSVGANTGAIGDLFNAASSFWSLGASVAQTVFDFGATRARVRGARAAYDQVVANYRQSVLGAFQQVEDNLAGIAAYSAESADAAVAADAATRAETIANNQYLAGIVDYTNVTQARALALSARQSQIQNVVNRQTASVALIQAIGGQWSGGAVIDPPVSRPAR